MTQRIPIESIRDSARRVMEHNEFRAVRRRVLEQVPETDLDEGFLTGLLESIGTFLADTVGVWIASAFRFLADLFPKWKPSPPAPSRPLSDGGFWSWFSGIDAPRILLVVILVFVLSIVVWLIARVVKSHRHDPARGGIPTVGDLPLELAVPPGELAASTYETRALALADQGEFAGAIRELLLGSMSWIERSALIRFRKGLTNRDYVRAVWRQQERRAAFLVTGSSFERVYFGRRKATAEMFQKCLTAFQGAFREESKTTPAAV